MKIQSRIGVTIPKDNISCCCTAQIQQLTIGSSVPVNLTLSSDCEFFDIEWQSWNFSTEVWDVAQTGGQTYILQDDAELLRVKLSKEGCCDKYTTAVLLSN